MNVLIINLTRFGDLIQTQPVISGFKALGGRVGLVCLENFSGAARLLRDLDSVFSLPGARLLAALDGDWRKAVRECTGFREALAAEFPADIVVNLTPSVSSRLLVRALAPDGAELRGFSVDEFGFNADSGPWAAFLQMAGGNRGTSPFNVCDLFRRTAGLQDKGKSLRLADPDSSVMEQARELLTSGSGESGKGFLAVQLGASEEHRRWPVAHFVRAAQLLWEEEKLVPVLLGTASETGLAHRFSEGATCPHIDLTGKTGLEQLGGVLRHCRVLITNDTGTMHLAAGLGVPVVAIFLATAQPWDTGPYSAGCVSLEPDVQCHPCEFGRACANDHECRHAVQPETVVGCVRQLFGAQAGIPWTGARVWRSVVGSDGFMALESLSGHGNTGRAWWIDAQRRLYRGFLDRESLEGISLPRCPDPDLAEFLSKNLTDAHDILFLLLQQGMVLAKNPREHAKQKFLGSWQRFQNLLESVSELKILGSLWMFESHKDGNHLVALLEMIERYRALVGAMKTAIY
ncbi:glycosyltransferase family 9 protein [Pseudodesulfovibrio tunisiensis]|uniref:glycosyltransferase family 9 protein n=1 Tax=Pseudodesulfovibrio tunisiensis TaxID=463192 RepID=UPI001FB289DF|nr:glycosyltransferase family 9 protein [Pseudodesulfovibrio tunisiensis]